jgi:hypothetical protein
LHQAVIAEIFGRPFVSRLPISMDHDAARFFRTARRGNVSLAPFPICRARLIAIKSCFRQWRKPPQSSQMIALQHAYRHLQSEQLRPK